MRVIKLGTLWIGAILSMQLHALPCFLTLVKDSCWTKYSLSVDVINATTNEVIATVAVPQGKSWVRQAIACDPRETLAYKATFSPVFWQTDQGKTYPGVHNVQLPEVAKAGDTAWNITVCYPAEFAGVPLPPDADGNCACDMASIPPVKPE